MDILITIGLIILGIIVLIGIIRVIFNPYTGLLNLMMELMLLDWLGDMLAWIIEAIADTYNDD